MTTITIAPQTAAAAQTAAAVQKKVCLLGGFSVGKTSLVKRYVESIFSETYITTVGVKVDKKTVSLPGRALTMILWDVAGEDDISSIRMSYVRGSAGYLLVADGTRPSTLQVAMSIRERVEAEQGPLPFALLINKNDLADKWVFGASDLEALRQRGWWVRATSARTGDGVEDAFRDLATRLG
jgi:small GTP-binding protein